MVRNERLLVHYIASGLIHRIFAHFFSVHERLRERASAAQGQPPRVLPRPPPKTSVPTQTPNGSANQVRAAAGFVPRTFCYTNAALGRGGGSSSTPPSTQVPVIIIRFAFNCNPP